MIYNFAHKQVKVKWILRYGREGIDVEKGNAEKNEVI